MEANDEGNVDDDKGNSDVIEGNPVSDEGNFQQKGQSFKETSGQGNPKILEKGKLARK